MKECKKIFEGKKYVVLKTFWVNMYDVDNDEWTDDLFKVKKGKYYYLQENYNCVCGADIRLENGQGWIEISKEWFEEYFKLKDDE